MIKMKAGTIEYKMPEGMAEALLKTRKATEKNMNPEDFLIKVVNESFNLRGTCVGVSTF